MEKIPLVDEKNIQETLEWAKTQLEALIKIKKHTTKNALTKEYIRTFINNPTEGGDKMKTLNDFRKEVKKLGYNFKVIKYSEFRSLTFTKDGKELTGNCFTSAQLEERKPLFNFIRENEETIRGILKTEGIVSKLQGMR